MLETGVGDGGVILPYIFSSCLRSREFGVAGSGEVPLNSGETDRFIERRNDLPMNKSPLPRLKLPLDVDEGEFQNMFGDGGGPVGTGDGKYPPSPCSSSSSVSTRSRSTRRIISSIRAS